MYLVINKQHDSLQNDTNHIKDHAALICFAVIDTN